MVMVNKQLLFPFMDGVKLCEHEWICGSPICKEGKWCIKTKCVKCGEPIVVKFSNKNPYETEGFREYKQLLEGRRIYDKEVG